MSGLGATADIAQRYGLGASVAFDPTATMQSEIAALPDMPIARKICAFSDRNADRGPQLALTSIHETAL